MDSSALSESSALNDSMLNTSSHLPYTRPLHQGEMPNIMVNDYKNKYEKLEADYFNLKMKYKVLEDEYIKIKHRLIEYERQMDSFGDSSDFLLSENSKNESLKGDRIKDLQEENDQLRKQLSEPYSATKDSPIAENIKEELQLENCKTLGDFINEYIANKLDNNKQCDEIDDLSKANAELRTKNEQLENTIIPELKKQLQNEISDFEKYKKEQDSTLTSSILEKDEEIKKLLDSNKQYEAKIISIRNEVINLRQIQVIFNEQKEIITSQKEKLDESEKQREELEKTNKELIDSMNSLSNTENTLKEQLEKSFNENTKQKSKVATLQNAIDDLRNQMAAIRKDSQDADKFQTQLQDLQKEVNNQREVIELKEKEIKKLQNHNEILEEENESMKSQFKECFDEKNNLIKENEELKNDSRSDIDQLKAKLDSAEKMANDGKKAVIEHQKYVADLKKTIESLKKRASEAESNNDKYQSDINTLRVEIEQLRAELSKSENSNEEKSSQLSKLNITIIRLQKDLDEANEKINDLQKNIEDSNLNVYINEINNYKIRLGKMTEKVEKLKKTGGNPANALRARVAALELENADLLKQKETIENQLTVVNNLIKQYEIRIKTISTKVNEESINNIRKEYLKEMESLKAEIRLLNERIEYYIQLEDKYKQQVKVLIEQKHVLKDRIGRLTLPKVSVNPSIIELSEVMKRIIREYGNQMEDEYHGISSTFGVPAGYRDISAGTSPVSYK